MIAQLPLLVCLVALLAEVRAACQAPEEDMLFTIELRGDWSPLSFPKQYPKFRPNAQFSPSVGAVHNSDYTMWEEGRVVSRDFAYFVNDDLSTKLVNSIKRTPDANSFFVASKIKNGVGRTSKTFTATRDFHYLSFASHLVPSPDWFIGLSKLDLCQGSQWLQEPVTIDLRPLDAGTDQGFMFTSPDYEESPYIAVQQITSQFPDHPANSFYYPQLEELPRIAHVTISRAAAADTLAGAGNTQDEHDTDAGPLGAVSVEQPARERPQIPEPAPNKPASNIPAWFQAISNFESSEEVQLTPVDCGVTSWGAWGECDDTCAVGVERRYRIVQQKPLNGGRKCDSLIELRICNIKLALKKPQKKKCANKKMKKERKKYNAKQLKKMLASLNNIYIV